MHVGNSRRSKQHLPVKCLRYFGMAACQIHAERVSTIKQQDILRQRVTLNVERASEYKEQTIKVLIMHGISTKSHDAQQVALTHYVDAVGSWLCMQQSRGRGQRAQAAKDTQQAIKANIYCMQGVSSKTLSLDQCVRQHPRVSRVRSVLILPVYT